MTKGDFRNEKRWNEWLAGRFENKKSVCVVIDLVPCRVLDGAQEWLSEDTIHKAANRFRNKLNHHYYGKAARRYGKGLTMTIHLHKEPQKHFHCVIGLPQDETIEKFQSVVETICQQDGWMKPSPYVDETKSQSATQSYNGRHGSDALIVF